MTRAALPTVPDLPKLRRGVDISKWQDPAKIDWHALSDLCDFVVCRFCYGVHRDSRVERHVELVRRHAMSLGGYLFYRPHQSPRAQFEAFCAVDEAVGYDSGDLVPWLDLERDPGAPPNQRDPSPDWSEPAHELCDSLVAKYSECLPYLNQADFLALGSPAWLLERPLAVAHWTERPWPTTPGGAEWLMWQRRVAPLPPASALPIDQDVAKRLIHVPYPGPLGLTRGEVERIQGITAKTIDDAVRNRERP